MNIARLKDRGRAILRITMVQLRTGSEQTGGWGKKEMTKNIQTRRIQSRAAAVPPKWSAVDADELKAVVRDGLVGMSMTEREQFIGTLEAELRRSGLNMR